MSVEEEERVPPGADLERYVRELAEFVGLGEADAALIRESAPAVLKHEGALTTALYEHFLKFPARALAAAVAWNKLLLLHLNVLLIGYLLPPRPAPREPAGPRGTS